MHKVEGVIYSGGCLRCGRVNKGVIGNHVDMVDSVE